MMIRNTPFVLLTVLTTFAAGCGKPPADPGPSPSNATSTETAPNDAAADGQPTNPDATGDPAQTADDKQIPLTVADWKKTQEMVAQHAGKVVVLDIWSSWCIPCKREFPNLVKLHREYPDDVVCMSMNIDYAGFEDETPESHREEVMKFLSEQNATFQNILSRDPDEKLLAEIELDSVPAVYVFDRNGKVAKRFDNTTGDGEEFTYEHDIIPLIEKLLSGDSGEPASGEPANGEPASGEPGTP